jgi:hypothetical protein
MIVWGGKSQSNPIISLNDGGIYNLATDSWTPITISGQNTWAVDTFPALWTGWSMMFFGGLYNGSFNGIGAFYIP